MQSDGNNCCYLTRLEAILEFFSYFKRVLSSKVPRNSPTRATTISTVELSLNSQPNVSTGWKHVTFAASTAWTPSPLRLKRKTISSSSWSRRMMCHTFGPQDVCAISTVNTWNFTFYWTLFQQNNLKVARVAKTCCQRTSTAGSGQPTARKSNQPTATQSDSATIHGPKPDTRRFHSQTTLKWTSTRHQSHVFQFSTMSTTMESHG